MSESLRRAASVRQLHPRTLLVTAAWSRDPPFMRLVSLLIEYYNIKSEFFESFVHHSSVQAAHKPGLDHGMQLDFQRAQSILCFFVCIKNAMVSSSYVFSM